MSHFNADQIQRLSAFAQAEALHDRMLEEFCALIDAARPALPSNPGVSQRLLRFLGGGFAACSGIAGFRVT